MKFFIKIAAIIITSIMSVSCNEKENIIAIGQDLPERNGYTKVNIRASLPKEKNSTRLDVRPDERHGLKTTWTIKTDKNSGDKVHYCYKDNNNNKHYATLECVRICENHSTHSGGAYAEFQGYIPEDELGLGLIDCFLDKTKFVAAIVEPAGGHYSFNEDNTCTINLKKQTGELENLKFYDLLHAGKYEGNTLKFSHKKFVYFHFQIKSDVCKGKQIKAINYNFLPASCDKEGEVQKFQRGEFPFLKNTTVTWDDEQPTYEDKYFLMGGDESKGMNYLETTPEGLKFDDNTGLADIYLIAGNTRPIGRASIQILTDNKKVLSACFYIKASKEEGCVYTGGKNGHFVVDMDRDNAVGMFLYKNGGYGPLYENDIFGKKQTPIGVCCSNKVSTSKIEFPPNATSRFTTCFKKNSDKELGYKHYAMGLRYEDVYFCEKYDEESMNLDYEMDHATNKTNYTFMSRMGRQYTDGYMKYKPEIFGYKVIYDPQKGKDIPRGDPKLISEPFLPASGQLYQAVCNLAVTMNENYEFEKLGQVNKAKTKSNESKDFKEGVEIMADDNQDYINFRGKNFNRSIWYMLRYYTNLGNLGKEPIKIDEKHVIGVNIGKGVDEGDNGKMGLWNIYYTDEGFTLRPKAHELTSNPNKNIQTLVPFYAFVSYGEAVNKDEVNENTTILEYSTIDQWKLAEAGVTITDDTNDNDYNY